MVEEILSKDTSSYLYRDIDQVLLEFYTTTFKLPTEDQGLIDEIYRVVIQNGSKEV